MREDRIMGMAGLAVRHVVACFPHLDERTKHTVSLTRARNCLCTSGGLPTSIVPHCMAFMLTCDLEVLRRSSARLRGWLQKGGRPRTVSGGLSVLRSKTRSDVRYGFRSFSGHFGFNETNIMESHDKFIKELRNFDDESQRCLSSQRERRPA